MKTKLTVVLGALLIAWALKRHYSDARPDDLLWILTPTARLVGAVTGAMFTWVPDEGYFAREQMFLIEKACAGVNFMIAAFAMLVWASVGRVRSLRAGFGVLGLCLAAGYAAAVLVNTVRIGIAMWLAAHPAVLSAFAAAEVHRVEGVVVYFGGLVTLYEMTRWLVSRMLKTRRTHQCSAPPDFGDGALDSELRAFVSRVLRIDGSSALTAGESTDRADL